MERESGNFTSGSIAAKLTAFMLPILAALVLQAAYGAVDVMMVGMFGTVAGLSGVSTGSSVISLVTFVVTALASAITVMLGTAVGSGDARRAGRAVGNAITFFALLSVVLTIALVALAEPVARLMKAPEEALSNTVSYIRICGMGTIFIVSYNVISCIMRGLGDSRLPLVFVAIACVANIIGDYVLIRYFAMDESGAAIATVASQALSVVLSLLILKRKGLPFRVTRKDLVPSGELGTFLHIGFPLAAQETMTQISFLALIAFINNIGLEASGGYGVANKIVSFIMLIPSSLTQSLSSFVAQNVGAGKIDRAKKALRCGIGIGVAIGSLTCLAAVFAGEEMSRLFSSDAGVIRRSAEYLMGFAPEAIVTSILFSFCGYFSGRGKTVFVMAQSLAQTFLVRLPVAYVMSIQPDPSLTMIGLAAPLATIFGICLNLVFFAKVCRQDRLRAFSSAK